MRYKTIELTLARLHYKFRGMSTLTRRIIQYDTRSYFVPHSILFQAVVIRFRSKDASQGVSAIAPMVLETLDISVMYVLKTFTLKLLFLGTVFAYAGVDQVCDPQIVE